MATALESTFRIHDQGVSEVAARLVEHGFRQMFTAAGGELMDREFAIRKQRRLKPEQGLMPYDIEAMSKGRRFVLKIFATGADGEHSSLWRGPGYLIEGMRIHPLYIGVVTGCYTQRMREVFRTTHGILQTYGKKSGNGVACLVHLDDLFNGRLEALIEQGGGIAAAPTEKE